MLSVIRSLLIRGSLFGPILILAQPPGIYRCVFGLRYQPTDDLIFPPNQIYTTTYSLFDSSVLWLLFLSYILSYTHSQCYEEHALFSYPNNSISFDSSSYTSSHPFLPDHRCYCRLVLCFFKHRRLLSVCIEVRCSVHTLLLLSTDPPEGGCWCCVKASRLRQTRHHFNINKNNTHDRCIVDGVDGCVAMHVEEAHFKVFRYISSYAESPIDYFIIYSFEVSKIDHQLKSKQNTDPHTKRSLIDFKWPATSPQTKEDHSICRIKTSIYTAGA